MNLKQIYFLLSILSIFCSCSKNNDIYTESSSSGREPIWKYKIEENRWIVGGYDDVASTLEADYGYMEKHYETVDGPTLWTMTNRLHKDAVIYKGDNYHFSGSRYTDLAGSCDSLNLMGILVTYFYCEKNPRSIFRYYASIVDPTTGKIEQDHYLFTQDENVGTERLSIFRFSQEYFLVFYDDSAIHLGKIFDKNYQRVEDIDEYMPLMNHGGKLITTYPNTDYIVSNFLDNRVSICRANLLDYKKDCQWTKSLQLGEENKVHDHSIQMNDGYVEVVLEYKNSKGEEHQRLFVLDSTTGDVVREKDLYIN